MLNWLFAGNNLITDWATAIVRVIWQGSIVFALVWLILLIFPKIHPNLRCWLWRLAYLRLLISFLGIPAFQLASVSSLELPSYRGGAVLKSYPLLEWVTTKPSILNLVSPNFSVFSISKLWLILWIVGIGLSGTYLMVLWRRNRKAGQDCYRVNSDTYLADLYQELCREIKIKKQPRFYLSNSLTSPSLQGLVHPKVILPSSFLSQYPPEEIKLMLAHELAHFKRGDLFWNWLPVVTQGLFFFHPLVWLAGREWRRLHEICSDRLAIEITQAGRADYGKVLLKAACRQADCGQEANPSKTRARARFGFGFNSKNQLVQNYVAESIQTLKKRLLALDYPEKAGRKLLPISVLLVILFGLMTFFPWKLSLFESPSVFISVHYSEYGMNAPVIQIYGHVLHAGAITIKKAEIIIDDQYITPWGYTNNDFQGYRGFRVSGPFNLKGVHRLKLLVSTSAGTFQEKYDFVFDLDSRTHTGLWINRSI